MPEYIPFIKSLNEKVFLKKTIIDILQKESHELDYEGLLNILSVCQLHITHLRRK